MACSGLRGTITDIDAAWVRLTGISTTLPGPLTDYRFAYTTNTTDHTLPAATTLNALFAGAGYREVGIMLPGQVVEYEVTRFDAAPAAGELVVRAYDRWDPATYYWDATMSCDPGGGWRRGSRVWARSSTSWT